MAKRKQQSPETPLQKGSRLRREKQQALMAFLHRKPSDCGLDVDQYVADAKERLKREKQEKIEITPMRPADWQTAFLTSKPMLTTPAAKVNKNCKRVKSFKTTGKDWGKAGHAYSNKRLRDKQGWKTFRDEVSYAR